MALADPAASEAEPIPEYRASYRSIDESVAVSADVSLSHDAVAETYVLVVDRVDTLGREIETRLRFNLVDDQIRPIAYREKNSRCLSCTVTVSFDWNAGRFKQNSGGYDSVQSLIARDGSVDGLVHEIALFVGLLPGRRGLARFDSALTTKSLGIVELETPLGTVRAEGRALQGPPAAAFWLAPELEHLPVRIQAFRSFAAVQLVDLQGIALSSAAAAESAGPVAALAADVPATAEFPLYRAVYRVDDRKTVGAARIETAVTHDQATDTYKFAASVIETKHPDRPPLLIEMPFRLVGERVQPLEVRLEQRSGRRPYVVGIEFDWALRDAMVRYDDRRYRRSLVAFDEEDERELRVEILEPLAGMLSLLPGDRKMAGFDDVLATEALGQAEVSLPIGTLQVERVVLHGEGEDMSWEVWRARQLADLPVRFFGPMMGRRATTFELTEVQGLERAVPGDP